MIRLIKVFESKSAIERSEECYSPFGKDYNQSYFGFTKNYRMMQESPESRLSETNVTSFPNIIREMTERNKPLADKILKSKLYNLYF